MPSAPNWRARSARKNHASYSPHAPPTASMAGKAGVPARHADCASKFALGGVFEALRSELGGRGVDVTMIFPGVVATAIRRDGLNGEGKAAGISGLSEENAMSVEECARQM